MEQAERLKDGVGEDRRVMPYQDSARDGYVERWPFCGKMTTMAGNSMSLVDSLFIWIPHVFHFRYIIRESGSVIRSPSFDASDCGEAEQSHSLRDSLGGLDETSLMLAELVTEMSIFSSPKGIVNGLGASKELSISRLSFGSASENSSGQSHDWFWVGPTRQTA